jgi:hypothetical protein
MKSKIKNPPSKDSQAGIRGSYQPIYRELVGLLLEKNPTQEELQKKLSYDVVFHPKKYQNIHDHN